MTVFNWWLQVKILENRFNRCSKNETLFNELFIIYSISYNMIHGISYRAQSNCLIKQMRTSVLQELPKIHQFTYILESNLLCMDKIKAFDLLLNITVLYSLWLKLYLALYHRVYNITETTFHKRNASKNSFNSTSSKSLYMRITWCSTCIL